MIIQEQLPKFLSFQIIYIFSFCLYMVYYGRWYSTAAHVCVFRHDHKEKVKFTFFSALNCYMEVCCHVIWYQKTVLLHTLWSKGMWKCCWGCQSSCCNLRQRSDGSVDCKIRAACPTLKNCTYIGSLFSCCMYEYCTFHCTKSHATNVCILIL